MKYTLAAILLLTATPVLALDPNVKAACRDDYFQYCVHTTPGTSKCNACFRKFAIVLKPECKVAIRNSPDYKNDIDEYLRTAKK